MDDRNAASGTLRVANLTVSESLAVNQTTANYSITRYIPYYRIIIFYYMPNETIAFTSLSATSSGSCLAISTMLNNFLTPMLILPSLSNPACSSIVIARLLSPEEGNSSTSFSTDSSALNEDIGGTRSSESKTSDICISVNIGLSDVVAMIKSRRSFGFTVCQSGEGEKRVNDILSGVYGPTERSRPAKWDLRSEVQSEPILTEDRREIGFVTFRWTLT
jgi:hypothetical protein